MMMAISHLYGQKYSVTDLNRGSRNQSGAWLSDWLIILNTDMTVIKLYQRFKFITNIFSTMLFIEIVKPYFLDVRTDPMFHF